MRGCVAAQAHLLRKVLRAFNADGRVGKQGVVGTAEKLAQRLDKHIMRPDQVLEQHRSIAALDASNLAPGARVAAGGGGRGRHATHACKQAWTRAFSLIGYEKLPRF